MGAHVKHFDDAGKNADFEGFLDGYWPLWREPKNIGGIMYHNLKAAFDAGWKASYRASRR